MSEEKNILSKPISHNNSDKAFWKDWFHLTDTMHLNPDEVQDFKNEGRR